MRTLLRVLLLTVLAAVSHFLALGVLMSAGVGPFGRGLHLLASGAINSYNEATSQIWFATAEHFVMADRLILWPTIFLLASFVGVRYVPSLRWWHPMVIACAILPLSSLPMERASAISGWFALLAEVLAYAILIGALSYALRKVHSRRQGQRAAA